MTTKEFIKKWNVAFESKEQELEFAKEMELDLIALTTPTPSAVTEDEINWEGFQDYLYNNNYHWENGAFWFDDDEEGNQELSLKELYQWYLEVQN